MCEYFADRLDLEKSSGRRARPDRIPQANGSSGDYGRRPLRPKSRIDAPRGRVRAYGWDSGAGSLSGLQSVGNGVVNEGYWSTLLGLPGWPAAGEEAMVMRNILLAELCNHPIHCQHISTAGSVRLIREARARGVKISGEVCPHHIALTDDAIQNFETNFKMNPPLRSQHDVDAIVQGIADGTFTILASDHAPHAQFEKEVEFDAAPFGIVGLETELGLFLDLLIHKKRAITINRLVEMYTVEPAKLLNIEAGTLSPGARGDVTIIDANLDWRVNTSEFESLSRNTPFGGWKLRGRAVRTIVNGETGWELNQSKRPSKIAATA